MTASKQRSTCGMPSWLALLAAFAVGGGAGALIYFAAAKPGSTKPVEGEATQHNEPPKPNYVPVKSVILMISDGFGPASQTLARDYVQYTQGLPATAMLPLDHLLVGSSRTQSSSSYVTDSAAGATAFACGIKSYNGAIAVDPQGVPCGTVLEAAKARGMYTGLVATSRITHATPATFSSHVASRASESDIAVQQIGDYVLGRNVDLMFGGGYCFFQPNSTAGSCRQDNVDAFAMATQKGFKHGISREFFDQIAPDAQLPLMALFTPDHMSYEIDRDPKVEPSLKEMALKSINLLERASAKDNTGFFLMIEGSRIDMAGHGNDAAAHVHDILAYNDAIQAVKEYVDAHPDVVMISVSDHETGGLSVAVQLGAEYPKYEWYPWGLNGVSHSGEYVARSIKSYSGSDLKGFVKDTVLTKWLNMTNPLPEDVNFLSNKTALDGDLENYVGTIVSRKAGLGWATHGHSAVDVNLYAYGAHFHELTGNHENTEIGDFIARNLHLDLKAITQKLTASQPAAVNKFRRDRSPLVARGVDESTSAENTPLTAARHYHNHIMA